MKVGPVPGAVIGVVRGFRTAWIAPLGVLNSEKPAPVQPSSLFQAASLTKQLAAYAALALNAAGKLDLDKPLADSVDDLRDDASRRVTPRHVLSHSSGWPNWRWAAAGQPAPELTPAFAPGSKFQYSGEGYFYLQRVMEQAAGRGFARLVRDLVFEPLGMRSSTLLWDPATMERTAQPHDRRGALHRGWERTPVAVREFATRAGKPAEDLRYEEYSKAATAPGRAVLPNGMTPNAASSLLTSAEDYAVFLAAALRNREIGRQQVAINDRLGWGLGWGIERAAGRTWLWQWGDNPGYKNIVVGEPATGDAIFVFTNGDSGARIYDRALTRLSGQEHPLLFWL